MSDRASIFDDDDLDLTGFVPNKDVKSDQASLEAVRAVSEKANFRSREAAPAKKQKPAGRQPRVHRTGRNVQLAIKVRQEDADSFYEISDNQDWVLGETFEKAIAALRRELDAARVTKS